MTSGQASRRRASALGRALILALVWKATAFGQAAAPLTEAEFNARLNRFQTIATEQINAGQWAAAVKTYQSAAALADSTYGPGNAWTAVIGYSVASCHMRLGEYAEALRVLESGIPVLERTYGRENEPFLNMLLLRGFLRGETGHAADGLADLQASLAIAGKICPPQHPAFIMAHKWRARAHQLLKQYDQAEAAAREAIAHVARHEPQNTAGLASTRSVLNDILVEQGRWSDARVVQEQILPEFKTGPGLLPYDLGNLYASMLETLVNLMDWPAADRLIPEALAYVDQHRAAPESWQPAILCQVASRESKKPDVAAARAHYTRALEIARNPGNPAKFAALAPLAGLGWCHEEAGDAANAEAAYREALELAQAIGDSEKTFQAWMEMCLARVSLSLRDLARAEPHAQRSVKLYREVYPRPHPSLIAPLQLAGEVAYQLGHAAESWPLLEESVALAQQFFDRAPDNAVAALETMGYVWRKEGRSAAALANLDRLLETASRFGINGGMRIAAIHGGRSLCLRDLRRFDESLAAAGEALHATEGVTTAAAASTRRLYQHLFALASWNAGRSEEARAVVRETLPDGLREFQRQLASGSEEQSHAWAVNTSLQDLPANLGMAGETASIIASTKGAILESLMARRRAVALAAGDPEIRRLSDDLAAARRALQGQLQRPSLPGNRATIKQLQEEVERREAALARAVAPASPGLVTAADIAAQLPPGSALLDWFRYRRHDKDRGSDIAYGLLVHRPGKPVSLHTIGSATEVVQAIGRLSRDQSKGADAECQEAARALLELVLGTAGSELGEVRTLYLCPDDALHLAPFAVLPDRDGKLLGERFAIRYLSSARDALRECSKPEKSGRIDIFANPQYRIAPAGKDAKVIFKELPESRRVARAIEQLAGDTGRACTVRTGDGATEAAVRELKDPGVLHLDTHGYFSSAPAEDLPDPFSYQRNDVVISRLEAPMERSGIALAGAEDAIRSGREAAPRTAPADGLLTAAEAAELHLDKTWLVVVDACSTARGGLRSGDGVSSLLRGFQIAGAQHVVATLWSAYDAAAADLMTDFYPRALRSGDAPQALLEAQVAQFRSIEKKSGWASALQLAGSWILVSRGR